MAARSARLKKLFFSVVNELRQIQTLHDGILFIDAICDQEDRAQCSATLSSKRPAIRALRKSLCIDLSDTALNGPVARCLQYLVNEEVRRLNGGCLLQDLLNAILMPPLLWQAYKAAATENRLTHDGLRAWACLLLESLITISPASPMQEELGIKDTARSTIKTLSEDTELDLRQLGYKIQEAVRSSATTAQPTDIFSTKPGGRHDNDFEDFRKIAIFPTTDELLAQETPFILPADVVQSLSSDDRVTGHLANQFRMLREDMLAELRGDLPRANTSTHRKKRSLKLRGLQFSGVTTGIPARLTPAAIMLRCWDSAFFGLPEAETERKKHFNNDKTFVKHGAFGCIMKANDVIAFATIDRNVDLLAKNPPVILLRVFGNQALRTTLLMMKTTKPNEIAFVSIDTPFFAYEPILTCLQSMSSLPLAGPLLMLTDDGADRRSSSALDVLAARILQHEQQDLRSLLKLPKETRLDHAQTLSLAAGLTETVSLVQGPPGTGKSFIGGLQAKAFLDSTKETILVLCYTNHALDQFLEDILDIGVSKDCMLRLGSKFTARTEPLTLRQQSSDPKSLPHFERGLWRTYINEAQDSSYDLDRRGTYFSRWKCSDMDMLESLEFAEHDSRFFSALSVPVVSDGMTIIGAGGRAIHPGYLFDRWKDGRDAGVFEATVGQTYHEVWRMPYSERKIHHQRWLRDAMSTQVGLLCTAIDTYDDDYDRWARLGDERAARVIRSKRLIGCTTTAAAKYTKQIASARPGIVLVEEAGEVLESHVLTALCHDTKQVVLIGDHQQLRPKVNNYKLTVESGEGYDLNRSLFERLVLGGHPHTVLQEQHRMRPEISALVRRLTYPDLQDSTTTLSRPDIRGLQSNVIFIDHRKPEASDKLLKDRRDESMSGSRNNPYESKMVLKTVRYLAQQGYGIDQQVVLTPYLGQLRLLADDLKADHDPVLNDLDSADLVKAGLLTPAGAQHGKRQLRVSTVDNFQGEESDIVIVSLTRSNDAGDIGFLKETQRLNVLLSRARNGLILIGNSHTFRISRKGRTIWEPFLTQLVDAGYFFDGLPVRCERHNDKCVTLKTPEDFDYHCPDGGCRLPCPALLRCGKHNCPDRCHQLVDHSKMPCKQVEEISCPVGHKVMWECWQGAKTCSTCERLAAEHAARQQRDLKLSERREQMERAYLETLQALDDEIADERRRMRDNADDEIRKQTVDQKKRDLAEARRLANGTDEPVAPKQDGAPFEHPSPQTPSQGERDDTKTSHAVEQWEYQKTHENASNQHIDALMDMIGLESVKLQVLDVKDKIDTTLRQGSHLEKERFGVVLLGNPGTGKTTVARLYARCLASMGAMAGNAVEETTASRLINEGVAKFKKLIEKVLNNGGGAIFIDEAYQLATGSGASGTQILDALLDEAENLIGKVVFILAGYQQEMEQVFAHNPGLSSRFPHEFVFEDYTSDELLQIFQKQIQDRFNGRMQVADGPDGLYSRTVARRIGYGRGRRGFGNARTVENTFAKIRSRQAARLSQERRMGVQNDDFLLTKEDLIGPEPLAALEGSKAWAELQSLIGLSTVKDSVRALMQSVRYNYERELREEARLDFNLNRVFLGSPGTGKTTVAKLYGKVLADLGLLSNGQVVVKNPSDFVGDALGVSEKNTRAILASTVGKILVIDEAYSLHGGAVTGGGTGDSYKTAVIDTFVAEIQSVPGEDRCVLLLGYRSQMEDMMQKVNPGLTRRFPLSEAFIFEDFSDSELKQVVKLKLQQQAYSATDQAMDTFMAVLQRARNKPHFGNAGEVDILLNTAKQRHQKRLSSAKSEHNATLEAMDIDPEFDRTSKDVSSVRALFQGTIGNEAIVLRLEQIQKAAINTTARGLDPRQQIPFNFVFAGPPGTGKTTTARRMGKFYYNMGILGSDEVMEVSATELVGQYVGQTGPKTQQLLERALGKVLFVDEAYRLAEGHFAKEAVDELVDRLTKPEFAQRLIIILAGYDQHMEQLMNTNPGLRSRFPEWMSFDSLQPRDCVSLLISRLQGETFLDTSALHTAQDSFTNEAKARFEILIGLQDWANARDIETLAKGIAREQLYGADVESDDLLAVIEQHVLNALDDFVRERSRRQASQLSVDRALSLSTPDEHRFMQPPDPTRLDQTTNKTIHQHENVEETAEDPVEDAPCDHSTAQRDLGVTDETWAQLEIDKQRAREREQLDAALVSQETTLKELQAETELERVREGNDSDEDPTDDLKERRLVEQTRLAREVAYRQAALELENLRLRKEEAERERQKEQVAQKKLRQMGLCVAGFQWIKQATGYRCAGGSHYVPNEALNSTM